MTQFIIKTRTMVVIGLLVLNSTVVSGQQDLRPVSPMQISVIPDQCVALRKGQTCYQEVELTWQSAELNNYCLFNITSDKELLCWSQAKSGAYLFDFQFDKSQQYAIRQQDSQANLASLEITLVWVYKSPDRPKASWRLF